MCVCVFSLVWGLRGQSSTSVYLQVRKRMVFPLLEETHTGVGGKQGTCICKETDPGSMISFQEIEL